MNGTQIAVAGGIAVAAAGVAYYLSQQPGGLTLSNPQLTIADLRFKVEPTEVIPNDVLNSSGVVANTSHPSYATVSVAGQIMNGGGSSISIPSGALVLQVTSGGVPVADKGGQAVNGAAITVPANGSYDLSTVGLSVTVQDTDTPGTIQALFQALWPNGQSPSSFNNTNVGTVTSPANLSLSGGGFTLT